MPSIGGPHLWHGGAPKELCWDSLIPWYWYKIFHITWYMLSNEKSCLWESLSVGSLSPVCCAPHCCFNVLPTMITIVWRHLLSTIQKNNWYPIFRLCAPCFHGFLLLSFSQMKYSEDTPTSSVSNMLMIWLLRGF